MGKKQKIKLPPDKSTAPEQLAREMHLIDKLEKKNLAQLDSKDKSLMVARLISGLTLEEWSTASSELDLGSWTAMPLNLHGLQETDSLANMLDDLLFQRDHDPLTGLANRRYFDTFFIKEMDRATRCAQPLSLAIIDLDKFKDINDNYGHLCGDSMLKQFGKFLLDTHRSYDLCVRFGGDEFLVVLPGVHSWTAKRSLENILRKLNEQEFVYEDIPPIKLTFSCGVAGVSAQQGYYGKSSLIKQADEALYEAKRLGRNQVGISDRAGPDPLSLIVNSEEKKLLFTSPELPYGK